MAKSDLAAGTKLEGIGGHHVHGFTVPATDAKAAGVCRSPTGCTLVRDAAAGATVTYADIELDEGRPIVAMRRLQDAMLANGTLG